MKMIDISPLVSPSIAVWPGDVAFSRDVALDMNNGDNLTLSAITSTLHLGAHTDAPNHYAADGEGISSRPLERYYGPAQVIEARVERGARITPDDLMTPVDSPRVLLKTGTYPNPNHFNEDFAALSPELVDYLSSQGVQLIGIDTPSVDLFDDKALLSHNAIARHDMAILEGVVLSHVTPGRYTLIALPLSLVGCDASPVRAALVVD